MSASEHSTAPVPFRVGGRFKTFLFACLGLGFITLLFGLFNPDSKALWPPFLLNLFYFTSLSLGGVFFVAILYVTQAGWGVTVRRIAESFAQFLPWAAILSLVLIFLGGEALYEWLDAHHVAEDALLQHKSSYLNFSFWLVRTLIYFAGWIFFAYKLTQNSLRQDQDGALSWTHSSVRWSIGFLLFFALSYSLFSVDYVMSLHPHWFSTIFGVYTFAGLFQSSLALLAIVVVALRRYDSQLKKMISTDCLHDIGKLLFAFTVFYAYIGFSQFMLIWYANLPEETIFFVHRAHGGWMAISLSLFLCKFVVPFLSLLPREAKRTPATLVTVSVLVLIMQYVDDYWLIYPSLNDGEMRFGFLEVGLFIGGMGLFFLSMFRFLSKHSVVPTKDPRLHEALGGGEH